MRVSFFSNSLAFTAILTCASALAACRTPDQPESSAEQSVDVRCDGRQAADIVTRDLERIADLPKKVGILLPNKSALYYHLAMREPHEAPADHRIYYGTNLQQFGDLRIPKGQGPFPVAVVIHGGGWSSSVGLHYMAPTAASLTCAGVATWNIEYRRLGSGGEWPGLLEDVAAATDFLREIALKYPLDLSSGVVSLGHSAGGHLALWLAMRHRLSSDSELYRPNPLPIRGAVSMDGVPDLFNFVEDVPSYAARFEQLFGAHGASKETFARRIRDASPESHLPLGVRQLLLQGNPGSTPPVGCCGIPEYVVKAQKMGDRVEYILVDGFHFEPVDPSNHQSGPAVRNAVRSMSGL